MNWYIGQEIVCIKTQSQGLIKRGKTYKINGLLNSSCNCSYVMIDVGVQYSHAEFNGFAKCPFCGSVFYIGFFFYFHESLFAPLDQDISELTEILEQPIKQVQEL